MKKTIWLSALFLLVLLYGCNPYNKIYSYLDESIDFTAYKSFAWLHDNSDTINSPYNNRYIRNIIRKYIGQCMTARAYQLERKNPDLLMQLVIQNTDKKQDISSYPNTYYGSSSMGKDYYLPYDENDYYYDDKFSYGAENLHGKNAEYVNRSITIIFIDRKTQKLVWRGTAKGDIFVPSELSYDLHAAIHKILSAYPVRPSPAYNRRTR